MYSGTAGKLKIAAKSGVYDPVSESRRVEIVRFIRKYGSGNCWTGTVGSACRMIHDLLRHGGLDTHE